MSPAARRPRLLRPSGIVTFLTDFGLDDPYVAALKGAVLTVNPRATLVDLTHGVPPQAVLVGALALERAYPFFPPGTVHVAVVDPGVGTARRALAVAAAGHYFLGPDNGLLGRLVARPEAVVVALAETRYHRQPTSRTFHGRDVFGPVAGHCSRGVPLGRLGPAVIDAVRLAWPGPESRVGRVTGQVLAADRFGNLLTSVTEESLPAEPGCVAVRVGRTRITGLVGTYADVPVGRPGALVDSSGRVEIFVRDGDARRRLRLEPGMPVSLWRVRRPFRSAGRPGGSARAPSPPSSCPTPWPSSGLRTGNRSRTSRRP